ncbi:MAG: malate synthase A, partial [Rhodospirillales bacterium]|nr:malate synthase A [Rhodospirillales bacterium]
VIVKAQDALGIPQGTVKATVLIETILASFELNEILYELREHSAGLNCGRWDYLFSFIKKFRNDPKYVLPDRGQVGMTQHFMRSYSLLVIKTCHRRNVHAIGGMAAQIPVRNDEQANNEAMEKVRADKEREANDGHDGTWVAHPGLVSIAKDIFDRVMPQPNQIDKKREDVNIAISDLLALPEGSITEAGLRQNLNVGVCYTEAWLRGNGCVALYNLMEDAATAEISRTQVWQWIRHQAKLEDGRAIDRELFEKTLNEELEKIRATVGDAVFDNGKYNVAADLFRDLSWADDFSDFLTLPAYEMLD